MVQPQISAVLSSIWCLTTIIGIKCAATDEKTMSRYGHNYSAKSGWPEQSAVRTTRCTPCDRDFDGDLMNRLDSVYRGNGADNVGYDWSPRAWGGLAFPHKSKDKPDTNGRGSDRGSRQMFDNWDNGGKWDRNCRFCNENWRSGHPDDRTNRNFLPRNHNPNESFRFDHGGGEKVVSMPLGVFVKADHGMTFIPFSSDNAWEGARWDGFGNGMSWKSPSWSMDDGRSYQAAPPRNDKFLPPPGYQLGGGTAGSSNWDSSGKGYYSANNGPPDNRFGSGAYAPSWNYDPDRRPSSWNTPGGQGRDPYAQDTHHKYPTNDRFPSGNRYPGVVQRLDYPSNSPKPSNYPTNPQRPSNYPSNTHRPSDYPTNSVRPSDYPSQSHRPSDYQPKDQYPFDSKPVQRPSGYPSEPHKSTNYYRPDTTGNRYNYDSSRPSYPTSTQRPSTSYLPYQTQSSTHKYPSPTPNYENTYSTKPPPIGQYPDPGFNRPGSSYPMDPNRFPGGSSYPSRPSTGHYIGIITEIEHGPSNTYIYGGSGSPINKFPPTQGNYPNERPFSSQYPNDNRFGSNYPMSNRPQFGGGYPGASQGHPQNYPQIPPQGGGYPSGPNRPPSGNYQPYGMKYDPYDKNDRFPYGDKHPSGNYPSNNRPYDNRFPSYDGNRNPYGDNTRPMPNRPYDDKYPTNNPYGGRPNDNRYGSSDRFPPSRPYGDNRPGPYGDNRPGPYGENKPGPYGDNRPGPYGDNKPGPYDDRYKPQDSSGYPSNQRPYGEHDRYPSNRPNQGYPDRPNDRYPNDIPNKGQYPNNRPDDRYPTERPGDSYDNSNGQDGDKNWNYGGEDKDGTYKRSGGSYPPYRGGQYFTSSYLASASTTVDNNSKEVTKPLETTPSTQES